MDRAAEPAHAALGLHTIGVGDGGNEIGMGRVEDYAIEGVVDHGENIACTVPTDQLVVAGTSNRGAHALVCAMRALGRSAVDPYLEPTWQERGRLDVICRIRRPRRRARDERGDRRRPRTRPLL